MQTFDTGASDEELGFNADVNADVNVMETATAVPPTGKRAAALKKCKKNAHKKHWAKKKLRKCKRKARKLPV
jgi:hypothetical protein